MKNSVKERFLRYVAIETTSDPSGVEYPSTKCQFDLLHILRDELLSIGCTEVAIDRWGYLTATIQATPGYDDEPVIGLLAHVDTSPDMSGCNVKPQIIENYDPSRPIKLGSSGFELNATDFEELSLFAGQTLITTDGTTLLGADDKAGVAEIITAAEYIISHPEISHGKIRIGFTPDEEIGHGVDHFDVDSFGADFAYTIDSGLEGSMEYENFNAAKAIITIVGKNIHPGYAKGRMVNALDVACHIHSMTPAYARPQNTEDREGFLHLHTMCGTVERATMEYIIRDHDREQFERKKELLSKIVATQSSATIVLEDQYYNMYEVLSHHQHVIERASQAIRLSGISPRITPIRGGTDGARLSFMGLPCPNIFTGGMNPHSRLEYVSVEAMARAVQVIINIVTVPPGTREV